MTQPPPLPADILKRVLRIGLLDGLSLLLLAGGFGLLSASAGDRLGAAVGFMVSAAGVFELRGRSLLVRGNIRGLEWLISAQLAVLAVIAGYAVYQYFEYDPRTLLELFEKAFGSVADSLGLPERRPAEALQLTPEEYLGLMRDLMRLNFALVAVASALFQGGLALYYHRRRKSIGLALCKS